jgi:hypothetical protein
MISIIPNQKKIFFRKFHLDEIFVFFFGIFFSSGTFSVTDSFLEITMSRKKNKKKSDFFLKPKNNFKGILFKISFIISDTISYELYLKFYQNPRQKFPANPL